MEDSSSSRRASEILRLVRTKKSDFWERERQRRPLKLFHEAARRVPAYKDFLRKNGVAHEKIKTFADFQQVPPVNKKNYLKKYPLKELAWDGTLNTNMTWTATSGSTGEPIYVPQLKRIDEQSSVVHELFFRGNFRPEESALVIVAFGMGVWIGGLITYKAFEIASSRGLRFSLLTPGINKKEIINALRNLAPAYDCVVLCGYAPFIKDVVDEAEEEGVDLKRWHMRFIFAAEVVPEGLREYIARKAGVRNVYLDTFNVYGTVELGTMAFESPFALLVKRLALKERKIFGALFGTAGKTPTLAQYIPSFVNFSASPSGAILITGDNALPLVRYDIGDCGGTLGFADVKEALSGFSVDIAKESQKAGICLSPELPFVYVYERSDLSVTLYGLQIYPEAIREVFLHNPLSSSLTGRFVLCTKYDRKRDQFLEINLETRRGAIITNAVRRRLMKEIVGALQAKSSEFRELFRYLKKRALPKLVFWPAEHPRYFKPGIKQRWVKSR